MNRFERKAERLQDVITRLNLLSVSADHPHLDHFIRCFLVSAPSTDIEGRAVSELQAMCLKQWELMQHRVDGEPIVTVFDPSEEVSGWKSPHTAIALINDDMPFLVDSATAYLKEQGFSIHLVIHPLFSVERNSDGRLINIDKTIKEKSGKRESCILFEIDKISDYEARNKLKLGLERVLSDVRCAVTDWKPMLEELQLSLKGILNSNIPFSKDIVREASDFLAWIYDNNFTFLGYRRYVLEHSEERLIKYSMVPESGLGLLQDRGVKPLGTMTRDGNISPEFAEFVASPNPIMITKSDIKSSVHRPVLMDCVGIKEYDENGRVIAEKRFLGLFTSTAYNSSVAQIPLLRRKVRAVLEDSELPQGGHDFKALEHVLESLPRDELFQTSDEQLMSMALGIFSIEERQRPGLFIRQDYLERFISCLVYVPRERYNTNLRQRMQWLLEAALNGKMETYTTQMSSSPLARIYYIIETNPGKIPHYDVNDIENGIIEAVRSWSDRLRESIHKTFPPENISEIISRYSTSFSTAYREDFSPSIAAMDLGFLEEARLGGNLPVHLYRNFEHDLSTVNLKIYCAQNPIPLTDIIPKLEHMGLKVISERPYRVRFSNDDEETDTNVLWIHDLFLSDESRLNIDINVIKTAFQQGLQQVWCGGIEDDGFNRLIVRAGIGWRQVVVLRAIAKYLTQVGVPFSQVYMEQTLSKHSDISAMLVSYFQSRFDPVASTKRKFKTKQHREEILAKLDIVPSLDEDRIIRRFINVIDSMLRTNYFQICDEEVPKPYLSFKLASEHLDEMPLPCPYVEVFVYSPLFEGIHLRGGKIARGGIRWSDRREDFRTEILSLMKAQMVKNAVIVPVGAKGGFVVKSSLDGYDSEARNKEGTRCYSMFISSLLELTDNYIDGKLSAPVGVVCFDSPDTYLVVAADKGTATFSDIANGIADRHSFWLGDAFASGGRDGYDHKKMGITARGAWESVKRHFRELGTNIDNTEFTVIGVGDMSGDVFGNGMLQSNKAKLIAAFNHQYIFIDPNPDSVSSYEERKRLFNLPNSNWSDYDSNLLSSGGLIIERSAKSIALTPEISDLFKIQRPHVTPNELIRALLKARADLIWFGGIGCYIKANSELNADTGDRANDSLRIDANDLRCKIIGEGANLALTQRGRVEFSLQGGRINTDAIDNSGGVDCSDHEVNIKILLNSSLLNGSLSKSDRNKLLEKMTSNVASLVLRNNYLQSQALTVELAGSRTKADAHARLMRDLERSGHLDREVEFLPNEELMTERLQSGNTLTRPELAILLASAKINVFSELIDSDISEDNYLAEDLHFYFPEAIQSSHSDSVFIHPLRKEIIATSVANSMINRAGCSFVNEMVKLTKRPVSEISRAYAAARHVFCLRELWLEIESLDNKVDSKLQTEMLIEVGRLLEHGTVWFLKTKGNKIDISEIIEEFADGVATLGEVIEDVLSPEQLVKVHRARSKLLEKGVPEGISTMIAAVDPLLSACDIVEISREIKIDVSKAAKAYFSIGSEFYIDWIRDSASELSLGSHWKHQAVDAIHNDLFIQQRSLCLSVLRTFNHSNSVETAILDYRKSNKNIINPTFEVLEDLKAYGKFDLAMLTVANAQIRSLIFDKS